MRAPLGLVLTTVMAVVPLGNAPAQDTAGNVTGLELAPFHLTLTRGGTVLARSNDEPLIVLLYSDAASVWEARQWRMIGPDRAEVAATEAAGSRGLVMHGFDGHDIRVEATATVRPGSGEVSWSIGVRNRAPGTVVGVIGPCLRNVEERLDGALLVPNRPGHRIQDPWNRLRDAVQHLEYPVPASMQYMAYYGRDGGVAVHVFDRDMLYKQLAFGGEGRQLTFIQYPFIAPGQSWESPEVLWQPLGGDWHPAADRYRAWFRSWARPPQLPAALEHMPMVPPIVIRSRPVDDTVLKDVQKHMELGTYEGALPRVREYGSQGMNGIHLVGWFGRGHDTAYPDHRPAEAMGGLAGLQRLVDAIHEQGMLALFYLNARLLSVTSPTYLEHPDWAAVTASGTPRVEPLSSEIFHVACPAHRGYRDHLSAEVLRVADRYAGDGVQLDQVGAAWAMLCFDAEHGHTTPAHAWGPGYVQLLEQVRDRVRREHPGFITWIEGAWEGAGQFVDISQGGFWPDHPGSTAFPVMYRYTLPEHPLFGDPHLGGVPYWSPADRTRVRRIYDGAADVFLHGEFRDSAGLRVTPPCEAHWFRRGPRVVVTLHNPGGTPQIPRVRLDLGRQAELPGVHNGRALGGDADVPVTHTAEGTVDFTVPVAPGQVEAVLLVGAGQ